MSVDSPVTFKSRPDGRTVAMLGLIEVGEIGSWMPGAFYWRLRLPFCCCQMRRAGSFDAAREQLRDKIEQWIDAAGLTPSVRPDIRAFRPDDWGKIKQAVRT
jgi:hypothetical protein